MTRPRRGRARSLVVYKGLAKAVRPESAQAVAHWWGLTPQTVTKVRIMSYDHPSRRSREAKLVFVRAP